MTFTLALLSYMEEIGRGIVPGVPQISKAPSGYVLMGLICFGLFDDFFRSRGLLDHSVEWDDSKR